MNPYSDLPLGYTEDADARRRVIGLIHGASASASAAIAWLTEPGFELGHEEEDDLADSIAWLQADVADVVGDQ